MQRRVITYLQILGVEKIPHIIFANLVGAKVGLLEDYCVKTIKSIIDK